MKKCLNCNSESLTVSNKESSLIPSAKYVSCMHCGNVMFDINDQLIATPTNDNARTKLLIQDAADCFGMEGIASLDGKTTPVEMQPKQTIDSIKEYIERQLLDKEERTCNCDFDCDDEEYDEEYDCEGNCDECADGCPDFEDVKSDALSSGQPVYKEVKRYNVAIDMQDPIVSTEVYEIPVKKNYMVLLHNTNEKHLYMNTSSDFVLNIINDIKEPFSLFELKHIPLKTEIKYSF